MNKLKSIWQIEDLRKKILFTLLLILVFRLGCSIPVPFVSNTALDSMFSNDSIFGYMNMLSGGALSRCAFFALGVSPYINSSIITQLLCVALPSWEALQKETTGKDKLDEYTKRIALAMAASAKETTKRTGVILCVVAASAAFMMLADTLFGAMLRFAI